MNITKKSISFILVLCMVITILATLGLATGVDLSVAATDYNSELWLKEDFSFMLNKGTRAAINSKVATAAPYSYMGESETIYVPISALCAYRNGNWTKSGNNVTITLSSNSYTMTVGSTAWKKNGTSQTAFLLPVVEKDGEIYLSNLSIKTIFGVQDFRNRDTGLIVYGTSKPTYDTGYTSLSAQITNMQYLLFDYPDANEVYNSLINTQGKAQNHPRLMADQDKFDSLKDIWKSANPTALTDDEKLQLEWINTLMAEANSYFVASFKEKSGGAEWLNAASEQYFWQPYYIYDENGNRLEGVSEYTYKASTNGTPTGAHVSAAGTTVTLAEKYAKRSGPWRVADNNCGYGYDEGGRSQMINFSVQLRFFGFAWQMTREQKWADAFYLVAKEFGEWEHWGEAHFLDCADGACEFALGYDWIYPAFSGTAEGKQKLKEMAEILYVYGVEVGYMGIQNKCITSSAYYNTNSPPTYSSAISSYGSRTLHKSHLNGQSWGLLYFGNNWQTVCASGIAISALAVMDEFSGNTKATNICSTVVSQLCTSINKSAIQYAPDGSYIESPGYWGYGTNTLMEMLCCFDTALGNTFGFLDMVGLQNSYYFAVCITDPEFYSWNYHDGNRAQPEGECFYMASRLFKDPNIAFFRDMMLEGDYGIKATILDVLSYDNSLSNGGDLASLDYYGKAIETVTMRSEWSNKNAIFAGVHAGANNVSHGDMDSGNFYLSMGGQLWFHDMGSEDYNITNYFINTHRYYYYRKNPAGHNLVYVVGNSSYKQEKSPADMTAAEQLATFGQVWNSQDDPYASFSDSKSSRGVVTEENGAYAYVNMQPQYGAGCTSAVRGLMLTNSRSTVVLQDQLEFKNNTTLVWQVNYKSNEFAVEISSDGRTAYLQKFVNGEKLRLRATLLSDNTALKFTKEKDNLYRSNIVTKKQNERGTEPGWRLTIKADNVKTFNVAVVFELVKDDREVVGYKYVDYTKWETTSDAWVKEADAWLETENDSGYKYKYSDLKRAMDKIEAAENESEKFAAVREAYKYTKDIDLTDSKVKTEIAKYNSYLSSYNVTLGKVNEAYQGIFFSYIKLMTGIE